MLNYDKQKQNIMEIIYLIWFVGYSYNVTMASTQCCNISLKIFILRNSALERERERLRERDWDVVFLYFSFTSYFLLN